MALLNSGDVLEDRYRIEAPIARGGMSTVYRCTDLRLGRQVAAKVMDARYSDDVVFSQRFRREALSMANLNHPNIVGVYDYSAAGEHIYLIMELIHGGTLRELLQEYGPMQPHEAAAVMREVLTGLAAAHRAGLVHRDIKPENVLINSNHAVKLTDFGLVRAASAAQASQHQIVGTVSYLSPEQVNGAEIGPASDVYSAGILLFELLTGTTPFDGDTDLLHAYKRLDTAVPLPSSRAEGIPKLFDELVATATALHPEDRFTDAAEFLAALEDVSADLHLPNFTVPIPQHGAASAPTSQLPLSDTTLVTTQIPNPQPPYDDAQDFTVTHTPPADPDPTALVDAPGDNQAAALETSILSPAGLGGVAGVGGVETQTPVAKPNPYAKQTPIKPVTNRSKAGTLTWSVLVFLLVIAVAVGAWWFGSGRYGEIPQVVGMDQVQAVAVVEEAGYDTTTADVYSDDVPATFVVGTDPEQGQRFVLGRTVTVLVSAGQPTVPEFSSDDTFEQYLTKLESYSLTAEKAPAEYSDDVPSGKVVNTDPAPGTTVGVNTVVKVALSKGPAPTTIPNVEGMSEEKATQTLEDEGLDVSITSKFDATTKGGDAIRTVPAAGTTLPRGSKVTLEVSTAVEIPDVVGMTRTEATSALADAGIVVDNVVRTDNEVGESAQEVTSITPSEGSLVDPSQARVTLHLAGMVEVPRVIGSKLSDAEQRLEEAGFLVEVDGETNPSQNARVLWQSPSGGRAEPGSTIKLRLL